MLKVKKILAICLTTIMSMGVLGTLSTYAYENNSVKNSITKNQLFAVPEGGWSSINAKISYCEYYVPSGSNNKFTSREVTILSSIYGATAIPSITVGNVVHSNNKSFSNWNEISIIYDGVKWNGGYGQENTDLVTYPATTSVTGKFAFLFSCEDAIPATVSGSVDLALKTK